MNKVNFNSLEEMLDIIRHSVMVSHQRCGDIIP